MLCDVYCDTTLAFVRAGVHDPGKSERTLALLGRFLAILVDISLRYSTSVEKQTTHEGGFAMVNVSDDHECRRRFESGFRFCPKLRDIQIFGLDLRLGGCGWSRVQVQILGLLLKVVDSLA